MNDVAGPREDNLEFRIKNLEFFLNSIAVI